MTVVRTRHAFEGRALKVMGRRHRGGALHLLLQLPDGSRLLIPAAWTDLHVSTRSADVGCDAPESAHEAAATLGSVTELLQARTVVNALLRGLVISEKQDSEPSVETFFSIRSH